MGDEADLLAGEDIAPNGVKRSGGKRGGEEGEKKSRERERLTGTTQKMCLSAVQPYQIMAAG